MRRLPIDRNLSSLQLVIGNLSTCYLVEALIFDKFTLFHTGTKNQLFDFISIIDQKFDTLLCRRNQQNLTMNH